MILRAYEDHNDYYEQWWSSLLLIVKNMVEDGMASVAHSSVRKPEFDCGVEIVVIVGCW